jgi:hypothetical protein
MPMLTVVVAEFAIARAIEEYQCRPTSAVGCWRSGSKLSRHKELAFAVPSMGRRS